MMARRGCGGCYMINVCKGQWRGMKGGEGGCGGGLKAC